MIIEIEVSSIDVRLECARGTNTGFIMATIDLDEADLLGYLDSGTVKEYFNLVDRDDLDNAIYRGDIEVDRCAGLESRISKLEAMLDEAGINYE